MDEIRCNATGLARCLKAAEGKILSQDDVRNMLALPMEILQLTFDTRAETVNKKKEHEVDEDDIDESIDEHDAQVQLAELLGALMLSAPQVFEQVALPQIGELMTMLFESKSPLTEEEDLKLGMYIACDLIEHLKQSSVRGWPMFMPKVLNALHHKNPEIRQAAAYAINMAAAIPEFQEVATVAHDKLVEVVSERKKFPKKHDDLSKEAMDNMVAALMEVLFHQNFPAESWQLVFSKLPLRDDLAEAEKVHTELLKRMKCENPKIMGPNNQNLGKLLGIFSEVYGSVFSTDELNMDIRTTFAQIPKETLANLQAQFSQKQIKKIQRVLKELD